ncbi:hypothetical protein A1Q2_02324 [Trichosporon asahii var. asahii CBS 8904]|uniref:Uncharacterized protein n=1 Tax=Trichosporon asahii var. asahii (strain CBS 8904) TaxID=1220162 RepID=K1WQL8_TRIAC|nr:hypothetical protein A1Q2_02324 [Trichosporon asahii var. asahii CBS 8904]
MGTWRLIRRFYAQAFSGEWTIAEPSNIELGPYDIYIEPNSNTTVTIDYISIEIPLATNATTGVDEVAELWEA